MNDISHDEVMSEKFRKDPIYAAELINDIIEDEAYDELKIVLMQVEKAFGNLHRFSEIIKGNKAKTHNPLSRIDSMAAHA